MIYMSRFFDKRQDKALTPETASDILYAKPETSAVTVVSKPPNFPEEVIERLSKDSGMDNFTASAIEERKSAQRGATSDAESPDQRCERLATQIIRSTQLAIGAAAISDQREARIPVGHSGDERLTAEAIRLAAAVIGSADPRLYSSVRSGY